jgi:HEPN domain-containing protein
MPPEGNAVTARYPGNYEPVSEEEHKEALTLAESVVRWAEKVVSEG